MRINRARRSPDFPICTSSYDKYRKVIQVFLNVQSSKRSSVFFLVVADNKYIATSVSYVSYYPISIPYRPRSQHSLFHRRISSLTPRSPNTTSSTTRETVKLYKKALESFSHFTEPNNSLPKTHHKYPPISRCRLHKVILPSRIPLLAVSLPSQLSAASSASRSTPRPSSRRVPTAWTQMSTPHHHRRRLVPSTLWARVGAGDRSHLVLRSKEELDESHVFLRIDIEGGGDTAVGRSNGVFEFFFIISFLSGDAGAEQVGFVWDQVLEP